MTNGITDKSTKKWVVYKHTSPNNKVYIGITSTKPERRWRCGEGYIANKHFYNAIKKYGWDNFKHEILYEGLTLQEASIKEKELIKHFNSMNQNFGYNLTSGGRSDFRFSESALRKMSIRMQGKGNPMYGKTHTQEVRQKLSELFKGANIQMKKSAKYRKHKKEKSITIFINIYQKCISRESEKMHQQTKRCYKLINTPTKSSMSLYLLGKQSVKRVYCIKI